MEWQSPLCGCLDNMGLCIITYFAPCYTFGKNAEAIGEDCCLCGAIYFLPFANIYAAVSLRRTIRHSRGIAGSLCDDIMHTLCCPFCSLVQEAREVRGYESLDMVRA